MINTAFIRECVLVPEKTRSIRDAIAAGTSQYGMQTFDQSLWDLFQAGLVAYERRSKRLQRRRLQAAHAGNCVDGGHFAPVYAVGGIWRTVEAGFRLRPSGFGLGDPRSLSISEP